MARQTYGGGADDVIVSPVTIGSTQVAGLPASQSFQVWNLANTTQLTGIVDGAGAALTSDLVVSGSTGLIPVFQGPDGYSGALRLKHTVSGLSWILHPSTLRPGPDTIVVAASGSGYQGDYLCDGTADDVQINAALTALRAGAGGTVVLTAGTYNLAAPILVEGFDDVDVEQDLYLRGQGPKNTTLTVGSGVSCGVRLGKSVRAHVWDLGLTVAGSSDGIQAVASTVVPAGGYRSAWMSTIARVQVIGPFDGTDTGWALDLDNVFRATIQDVEVNGTTNGMRFSSSNSAFNPGDMTVSRCFVDIGNGANNGTAYSFDSVAGSVNQMAMITCHSIGNPARTGTTAWKFTGTTAHIRLMNCNVEQFATTAAVGSSAYDVDLDFVHVTLRNGSTLFDLDGYGNRARCGLAYVEPSATVTLVDDDNSYSAKPNVFGPVDIYADTGSTVNADVADTLVLRDVTWDGPGTIAAAVKQPTQVSPHKTVAVTDAATITLNAALGDDFRVTLGGNRTIAAPTNPTDGQRITLSVIQDATGSRTLAFNAAFAFGTITNTLTTTAAKRDIFEFVFNSVTQKWYVLAASKNV